ncbi:KamA family radical SAM protein [Candidatus Woesearchaeota archaeon]|nr:KamA family radical SAM protein [Candidatus Woesearchaeota archaeon]
MTRRGFSAVSSKEWKDSRWQDKNAIRARRVSDIRPALERLSDSLEISKEQQEMIGETLETLIESGKEPLRITPYYLSLIQKNPFLFDDGTVEGNLDPIFWQSVPTPAHLLFPLAGMDELMAEGDRSYGAVYQRYPNRVALFVGANTSCSVYCSFCQRQKSLDATTSIAHEELEKGLFYIDWNKNIDEVLVTGGDALRVGESRLRYVLNRLGEMEHIKSLRIATRVPVTLPMGVTEELLDVLSETREQYGKHIYVMTHVNHHKEVTEEFKDSINRIKQRGFTVLNQTVLLNHINADFSTLAETFRQMWWGGVKPYYLLQCHKERGMAHFIKPIQYGKMLLQHLQGWTSGTTKPIYAVNADEGGGKVLLMPSGYNTRDLGEEIRDQLYSPSATINTWDGRIVSDFEALGRASRKEFLHASQVMDRFIGRPDVFSPSVIIVDEQGEYIETTNRELPSLHNQGKAAILGYEVCEDGMPVTNPAKIKDKLDVLYEKSKV